MMYACHHLGEYDEFDDYAEDNDRSGSRDERRSAPAARPPDDQENQCTQTGKREGGDIPDARRRGVPAWPAAVHAWKPNSEHQGVQRGSGKRERAGECPPEGTAFGSWVDLIHVAQVRHHAGQPDTAGCRYGLEALAGQGAAESAAWPRKRHDLASKIAQWTSLALFARRRPLRFRWGSRCAP